MNSKEITKIYGEGAKVLFFVRHGFKTPDNHITPECLAKIEAEGIDRAENNINCLHEGSALVRTKETCDAFWKWLRENDGETGMLIPPDKRLGSDELFGFYTEEIKAQMKAAGFTTYEAMMKLGPDVLRNWETNLQMMVGEIFGELNYGGICLVPCHSPTVEAIFNLYADDKDKDSQIIIKELEGIFLVSDISGHIHAVR